MTHRELQDHFMYLLDILWKMVTWHNFEAIAKLEGTLVFLMGIKTLPIIVTDLISNGKCPDTPVAIIEKGDTSDQRVTVGTLSTIVDIAKERKIVPLLSQ